MKPILFGDIPVGEGCEPLLLPDIDMFFNRDLDAAAKIVNDLVKAGTRVIKGAVIHSADIALDNGTTESYYSPEVGIVTENYRELMERKVMSFEEHESLFELCKKLGPELVLSVYDRKGAEFAKDIGACALKIPSTNITHEPLIGCLGGLDLPVIIDTGKSTLEEIARAVQWARDGGVRDLILEHSPEAPPSPLENHNLKMIQTLRRAFECPVGLSDHHAGNEMMYAAVALGASVLEKGVCANDQGVDQDVYHSMRVGEVEEVLTTCSNIHRALGSGMRYLPRDRAKPSARMGLVAAENLKVGDNISESNVDFAFPAVGVPTENWTQIKGWRLVVEKNAGDPIEWKDIESV